MHLCACTGTYNGFSNQPPGYIHTTMHKHRCTCYCVVYYHHHQEMSVQFLFDVMLLQGGAAACALKAPFKKGMHIAQTCSTYFIVQRGVENGA